MNLVPTDLREQLQRTLGDSYTIERELGGGGMSRVFLARDTALGRHVVVKVLSPTLAADLSTDRFIREVRIASQLQQANIVPVFSTGVSGGLPYYTMPFVDGLSLRARLASGRLPIGREKIRGRASNDESGEASPGSCCRFSCRLTPTLSGIPEGELRQITLSVNDLKISCRTSYSPSVA